MKFSIAADGTPVRFGWRKDRNGERKRWELRAIRVVCVGCGDKFWAWPDGQNELCAACFLFGCPEEEDE